MYRLFELYKLSLKKRPHITNAIMTGSLFGIGDISAQFLFSQSEYPLSEKYNIVPTTNADVLKKYDYLRTIRAVTYGSLIFSFIGNKWYKIFTL